MKNLPTEPLQPGAKPISPGIPNPNCRTMLEARAALEQSRELRRAIRRLRWSAQRCSTCQERRECPMLHGFSQAMERAVQELGQEWGEER
jgi:hypothetical protein